MHGTTSDLMPVRRRGDLLIVECRGLEASNRFAVVQCLDDGTIAAVSPADVRQFGDTPRPYTFDGVRSCARLRTRNAAQVAVSRLVAS